MALFVEALEKEYTNRREVILGDDGFISTPFSVLRSMAKEHGTPVHMEFHEVFIDVNTRAYQVEMYIGLMRGRGEAPRRKLAIQIAAADVLAKVKSQAFEIAPYGLFPGCRINPKVFGDLVALCEVLKTHTPVYIDVPHDPHAPEEHLFVTKCQIGQLINIGGSDNRYIAKRIAAKNAYEALTGKVYPLDEIKVGLGSNLLEMYEIVPENSQNKIGILKYREEARKGSIDNNPRGSAGAAAGGIANHVDEFGEDDEMEESHDPNETSQDRVSKLQVNLHDIKARFTRMLLTEENSMEGEDD